MKFDDFSVTIIIAICVILLFFAGFNELGFGWRGIFMLDLILTVKKIIIESLGIEFVGSFLIFPPSPYFFIVL